MQHVFELLNEKVSAHTTEEDEQVFPAIRQLEAAGGDKAAAISTLRTEFDKLEAEHENTRVALERLRELTDGYTTPEWGCNTFRALYDGLHQMEQDMHQHVHKENNVLFPRVLALQTAR